MKKILSIKYILFFFIFSFNISFAEDLRDFKVGSNIALVPERGYVNIKCEKNQIEISKWSSFNKCPKNSDSYYIISFEYDERFAVTEEFEGTQVSGHPVLINIAVEEGILHEINIYTDPKAPFYFRKQSHLLWLRVYSKYGSQGWNCADMKQEKEHIKIGKEYINKACVKPVEDKLITIKYQFYFIGDKSNRDNLVSKSYLQIKLNEKV